MMMRILVTGAAGKTGRAVIAQLAENDVFVRAFVHREDQRDALLRLGTDEVAAGNLNEAADISAALDGIDKVYHICPNVSPNELKIGKMIIDLAAANGVSHFVFHSVLHPQTEKMPHHWLKLRVEEHLFESGLPYSILQPCAYMQNCLSYVPNARKKGAYQVPYDLSSRFSLVDLADIAQAASTVLLSAKHIGAIYELCGPEDLNQFDIAKALGDCLKRVVQAEVIDIPAWRAEAKASGLGRYQRDALTAMFRYYDANGFCGNPNVLSMLLGRTPTTFGDFLEREIGYFKAIQ